jgi:hypothetical protein
MPTSASPNASAILGSNGGAPQQNAQPTPAPNQPAQNQTATPSQLGPSDRKAHTIGRLVEHVRSSLEGKQAVFTPDPNTGTVTETQAPRKAGGFFRDLIGGMMAGLASASEPSQNPNGAAGIAKGFMAAQNFQRDERTAAQNNAQNTATQGYVKKQRTEADQLAAASVADSNMSSLNVGHHIGHFTDDEIDQHNASATALENVLTQNGGQLAQVDGNNVKGNGPALMAKYNNDQTLMQGPDGYHRVANISYDTNGLKHDGHQWTNEDGSALSDDEWNKRGTVNLIDIPNNVWGKQVTLPGSTIKDLAPNLNLVQDPKKSYSTTIGSVFGLGLKNKKQMLDARADLYRAPQNENEANALKAEADQINSDPNSPADLKRRAAIKGPLADKFLANVAAQKQADRDASAKGPAAPKTLAEASVPRTQAQLAYNQNPIPENKKALDSANAVYQGFLSSEKDKLDSEFSSQMKLAKGKAEQEQQVKDTHDRAVYSLFTSGDPTGWTPRPNQYMTESQFNSAKEKFGSGTLSKALDTDKSYQMFQDAYNEYKAAGGKLPTGAQSMLALSTHLSTTFGNVKGSRVTKDMIQEHLGARSVSDDALAAVQKLTSGDVLSPNQWKAFSNLIADSRNKTWDNATTQAHYLGLPADFLPQDYVQSSVGSAVRTPSTIPPRKASAAARPVIQPSNAAQSSGGFNWNALPKAN